MDHIRLQMQTAQIKVKGGLSATGGLLSGGGGD